ncbi:glycosyltransferase, partial [Achromobacter sp. Marseille-Q0513]|uniref:glycosyltransferase family 4 protein n=1 Tax=Achromobacter sp. Marseille-Q0513 TaxID=2829161 RepID=UPI001B951D3A
TNFHHGNGGGHTTYVLSLVRALQGSHDIMIAAPAGSRLFVEASRMPGLRVVQLDFKGGLLATWPGLRRMRMLLKTERFDLVHVNGAVDHRLCMLAGAGLRGGRPAIVYTQHNSRLAGSVGAFLRARLATDRVICVSEHTRRSLMDSPYA